VNEILTCEACGSARGWLKCACEYPCRGCGAQPGKPCTISGKVFKRPGERITYHGVRWRDAAESGPTKEVEVE
jgi:hypothetical protein